MPQWASQITNKYLAGVANAYFLEDAVQTFSIFPKVPVVQKSGLIAKYKKEDWAKIGALNEYRIAGAVETPGDDYTVTSQTFVVERFGFHKDLVADEVINADSPFDPAQDAISFVVSRIKRVLTKLNVATFMATSGVWGTNTDKTSAKWSTKSSGVSTNNPIDDIITARSTVGKATGFMPNKAIMTQDVLDALKSNTFITNSMKTTNDRIVTLDLIARLFDLDEIQILSAVNETATDWMVKGQMFLGYCPARPSKYEPSAGYNLIFRAGGANDVQIRRIQMPEKNDALRIEAYVDAKPLVVGADLGVMLYNLV